MKVLTPEQAQAALAESRKFYGDLGVALNGLVDKLPESVRASIVALKEKANGILEKLPMTDAVPLATETNYALNSLAYAWQRQQEIIDELTKTLNSVLDKHTGEMQSKETSLNSRVTDAITAKVNAGELFEKAKLDSLVEAAEGRGRDLALNEVKLIGTRKQDFATCGLPVPADEKLLLGDDAAYAAFKADLQARMKKLEGRGISLNKAPKLASDLAFSKDFDRDLGVAEEALKLTGGSKRTSDPLIGGASAGGEGRKRMAAC